MKPYAWSMIGEYWPHVNPLMLTKGQRVEIDLVNQTMMSHPMHLHGHAFQVIAIDGRPIRGAMRDTILVMPWVAHALHSTQTIRDDGHSIVTISIT
jgi:FtsP/CotA-like multicopper oxidase with cupredoxin domain